MSDPNQILASAKSDLWMFLEAGDIPIGQLTRDVETVTMRVLQGMVWKSLRETVDERWDTLPEAYKASSLNAERKITAEITKVTKGENAKFDEKLYRDSVRRFIGKKAARLVKGVKV